MYKNISKYLQRAILHRLFTKTRGTNKINSVRYELFQNQVSRDII